MFVPPQITSRDLDRFAQILQLSDDQKTIAQTFMQEYLEQIREIRHNEIEGLLAHHLDWRTDTVARVAVAPTLEDIKAHGAALRVAIRALDLVEVAFIADLGALLDEDQLKVMKIVELDRASGKSAIYHQNSMLDREPYHEHRVNLVKILYEVDVETDVRGTACDTILTRADALENAWKRQRDSHRTMQRQVWEWRYEWPQLGKAGMSNEEIVAHPHYLRDRSNAQRVIKAREEIVRLNREILEALLQLLPPEAQAHLTRAYRREAFPRVYAAENAPFEVFVLALALEDLTDEQRTALEAARDEFRESFEQINSRIVGVYRKSPSLGVLSGGDEQSWHEHRERQQAADKIKFERDDLMGQTGARVEGILTESQRERLEQAEKGDR